MRDVMSDDLRRKREVVVVQTAFFIRPAQNLGQWKQPLKHLGDGDAVVDQAGNFIDADTFQIFDTFQAIINRAKQTRVIKVAREGEFKDRIKFFRT